MPPGRPPIDVRVVAGEGFTEASRVAARSLVHLFGHVGPDPVDRLVAAYRTYAYPDVPPEGHLAVAAFAGAHPVAFARVTTPGHCMCDGVDDAPAPVDDDAASILAYRRFLAEHHPRAPHWWFAPVGVEPGLERRGLGRLVMAAAMAEIAARGGGPTVLEAAPEVAGFYRALGFADIAHEVDPDGDELVVQRRDLPPDPGTAEAAGNVTAEP